MQQAIGQAEKAYSLDCVPVGAVVLDANHSVIAAAHNQNGAIPDPTAHAEIQAIRLACRFAGSWRLDAHTLVSTLEPCVMCTSCALYARIPKIVFGAWDPKAGGCGSVYDLPRDARLPLQAEVHGGLLEPQCSSLLTEFFHQKRHQAK